MGKSKSSGKTIISINFDDEVLSILQEKCNKEKVKISSFVNSLVKQAIVSEYEFYRRMARNTAMELAKYRTLMDTATDKPKEEKKMRGELKDGEMHVM